MMRSGGAAPTVGLIVDSPGRDLAGMVLLGGELASRGARVLLIPMNLREREVAAVDPDLVVMNYVRNANQDAIRQLMDMGYDVGLVDTEGGIGIIGPYGSVTDHYGNILASDTAVRDRIRFVCAWGSRVASRMVEMGWYRADQVTVTGSPRFDWYHPSLRDVALEATPIEQDERAILIIGSFPAANPRFMTIEEEASARMSNSGYSREVIDEFRERDVMAMEETIKLTHRLAGDHPKVPFVFRPHPFERVETYVEAFRDLPNVAVRSEGPVEVWIHQALAVITPNDCTIGVEGAMAQVPVLVTNWIVPEAEIEAVSSAGHSFDRADELVDAVGQVIDGTFAGSTPDHEARVERVIADWFHRADGLSYRRVADVIWANARHRPSDPSARRTMHYVSHHNERWSPGWIQDRARAALRAPAGLSFKRMRVTRDLKWDRSAKQYSVADVQPKLDALNRRGVFGDTVITARQATSPQDYDYRYEGRTVVLEAAPASSPGR